MFVRIGTCPCEGGLASANHKLGFHVVVSSCYGELGGPMVGAPASAVAAVMLVEEAAWDLGAKNVDGRSVPTICAVFDLTLAEEPARKVLGDRPVRVAVLVTSSSSFGHEQQLVRGRPSAYIGIRGANAARAGRVPPPVGHQRDPSSAPQCPDDGTVCQ